MMHENVTQIINTISDWEHITALRLFRLSYGQKRARRDKTLTAAAYHSEIERLGFASSIVEVMPAPGNYLTVAVEDGES